GRNNINGIGAWAEIYYNKNQKQVYENTPYRGYLSSIEANAFFGLGNVSVVDSVIIRWPGNKKQILKNVKANQLLTVDIKNANLEDSWNNNTKGNSVFAEVTNSLGINFSHKETDYIDFNRETLIPHKLSQYSPGLAAADIDGNGLDDICIGGSTVFPGKFFLQQSDGRFIQKDITAAGISKYKNLGLLVFNEDGDGDLDVYFLCCSNEYGVNSKI